MTMISVEPAICKKCGIKQPYTVVHSWNKLIDPIYPANNICKNCGEKLTSDDIDMNKCSPDHRLWTRGVKIYNYWMDNCLTREEYDKYDFEHDLDKIQRKVENEMVSLGLIPSMQEEIKYKKKYYECLENKYRNKGDSNDT